MSAPAGRPGDGGPPHAAHWYVRPAVVLPVVSAMVVVAALLAPERIVGRTGDARLTTYSTEPQGAQLFYEMAQRLGWRVERRTTAALIPGTTAIHAVLDAPLPPRMSEVHALLEEVRNGAALLLVLGSRGDPIGDSLHVSFDPRNYDTRTAGGDTTECVEPPRSFVALWPDEQAHLYALAWRGPPPADTQVFLRLGEVSFTAPRASRGSGTVTITARGADGRDRRSAVVGFPYGRGRIVVASDPDFLRNDALRVCGYGLDVAAVRALEYLRGGGSAPRTTIVFDEYHQGFGRQPGTLRAVATFLGGTASGHVLFQLLGAGFLLLVAAAPRAIPPRDPVRVERRSPLEHVDALARAYAQVGATRTAVARLVCGVRRRLERGSIRAGADRSDEAFLERVEHAAPALAADVALVRRALATRGSRRELEAAGHALHHIESSLTRA